MKFAVPVYTGINIFYKGINDMTDKKPLLMNKELYNLLYDDSKTKKSKPKDKPLIPETSEEKVKAFLGIFCKGRYQSWIAFQNTPYSKKLKKNKERA